VGGWGRVLAEFYDRIPNQPGQAHVNDEGPPAKNSGEPSRFQLQASAANLIAGFGSIEEEVVDHIVEIDRVGCT
jgi:hypothetical protein